MATRWLTGLLGLALALPVAAQEPARNLQISAFGTVGFTGTDSHQVAFRRDASQPMGAIDKPDAAVDSRYGLQLSAKLGETLLGTLQVLSKYRYDGSSSPDLSLAMLAWNPVADLNLRAGILQLESLPNGDFANIGHTYLWVRPPTDVYGNLNFSRIRGMEVANTFRLTGETSLNVKVFAGQLMDWIPVDHLDAFPLHHGQDIGAALNLQSGAWRARLVTSELRLQNNIGDGNGIADLQTALNFYSGLLKDPKPAQAALVLNTKGDRIRNTQLGVSGQEGNWQVQGALARTTGRSITLNDTWSGFVSAGYRLGEVVPYGLFSRVVSVRSQTPDLGSLRTAGPFLPAPLGPLATVLTSKLDEVFAARGTDQHTLAAGIRWDFASNMDLKVQIDRIQSHHATGLLFVPNSGASGGGYPPGWNGRLTVFSVALDFIFGGGR